MLMPLIAHPEILVNVGISYTTSVNKATTRGKLQVQTLKERKHKSKRVICHDAMSRAEFIEKVLDVHGLAEVYTTSDVSGPPFTIWWKSGPCVSYLLIAFAFD